MMMVTCFLGFQENFKIPACEPNLPNMRLISKISLLTNCLNTLSIPDSHPVDNNIMDVNAFKPISLRKIKQMHKSFEIIFYFFHFPRFNWLCLWPQITTVLRIAERWDFYSKRIISCLVNCVNRLSQMSISISLESTVCAAICRRAF